MACESGLVDSSLSLGILVLTRPDDGTQYAVKYGWWAGEKLTGTADRPIAFDLETEPVAGPLSVPRTALGMAYDGESLVLLHPGDLGPFCLLHRRDHVVGHNVQFDFWTAHEELGRRGDSPGRQVWWDWADKNRLHDTMLLDMLVQLAGGAYRRADGRASDEARVSMANLAVLARDYGAVEPDKADGYRLRFGELLGLSREQMWGHPEAAGFFAYALTDVVATWQIYPPLRERAVGLMRRAGYDEKAARYEIAPDALDRFGPLSEYVQVRGSVALARLSRRPMPIDRAACERMVAEERAEFEAKLAALIALAPGLFKTHSPRARKYEPGSYKLTKKTGLPSVNHAVLKTTLAAEADRLGVPAPQSPGKTGGISTEAKVWARHADRSPFVAAWCRAEKLGKQMQFLAALSHDAVWTNYDLLKRTGRTSAATHRTPKDGAAVPSVNVQQIPRDQRVRELFRAEPGRAWYACDYAYVELRTLAGVCRARFGRSVLGDVIERHTRGGGHDPHEVMAMSLGKVSPGEWDRLPKDEKKTKRQAGKACFHEDVEVLTDRGWVRVADLTTEDWVANVWPESLRVEWARPLALTTREDRPLVRVAGPGIDVRVTPDHRMVGFDAANQPVVVAPADVPLLDGVWAADVSLWADHVPFVRLRAARFKAEAVGFERQSPVEVTGLPGAHTVYCLTTHSSFVVVRDGGKAVVIGQCSFGFPGGLGVEKFREYARTQYRTTFSPEEARAAKKAWYDLYPEMREYLADTTHAALAYNLGCPLKDVHGVFPPPRKGWFGACALRRLKDALYEGTTPEPEAWACLTTLVVKFRKDMAPRLADRTGWLGLHDDLFLYRSCTLTGRVRGRTGYCDSANNPFQSLASDGGKEALWKLTYLGYDPVMFVHDEIVVSLPRATAARDARRVERVMAEAMERVIGHGVPVACEGHLADYWVKG